MATNLGATNGGLIDLFVIDSHLRSRFTSSSVLTVNYYPASNEAIALEKQHE